MSDASSRETFGSGIESQMVDSLQAKPLSKFDELLTLRNLNGDNTGYIKVYTGPRIEKASSLSINMGPGMRYFNIHIIPQAEFDVPRFVFEGMLTGHGSQVSMDVFSDIDEFQNIEYFKKHYAGIGAVYDDARNNPDLRFDPSRQMHMRILASPFFLCTFGLADSHLAMVESYANQYWSEWLKMHETARSVSDEQATDKRSRRNHMARTLIDNDPDRHMVVQVYGEEMTQAIEAASML